MDMDNKKIDIPDVCKDCACINHQVACYDYDVLPSLADAPSLEHLSDTNDAPCPAEVQSLRGFLDGVKRTIDETHRATSSLIAKESYILGQLDGVRRELESLCERRSMLLRMQEETHSLLSPLRSLPSELLLAIFDQVLEDALLKHSFYSLTDLEINRARENEAQLGTLLRVCRRWRAEIIATPRLWSKILIDLSALPGAINLGAAESLDGDLFPKWLPYYQHVIQYVTHSQSAPVSITLYNRKPSIVPRISPAPPQALTFMLPFANRIRELQLFVPHQLIRQLSPLGHSLHALESVVISGSAGVQAAGGNDVLDTTTLFASAPRLRHLTLFDFRRIPQFAMNWKNITSFNANHTHDYGQGGLAVVQYLTLMRQMVALEACHLQCNRMYELGNSQTGDVPSLVVHYKLKRLVITCPGNDLVPKSANGLLDLLTLPALEHLEVDYCSSNRYSCEAICDMLSRSKCPLISLRVCYANLGAELIFLQETPTLEELWLENVHDTAHLGEGLSTQLFMALSTDDKNAVVPLPRLKTLHCSGVKITSGRAWADMVLSRWSSKRCTMMNDLSIRWLTVDTQADGRFVGPIMVALLAAELKERKPVGVKLALSIDRT
ncbi:hypothetical protein CYLTODRAFT_425907 [Cylindrobasidium torrendii FP15055 ss-10]|uniref:Uncharacterized protein n=1 Tax=Cylindrobasidium torrendii FP15055 ss-10 TaxID=1314674 RepID=A0A0D7AZ53_9AGAR|nr:hypothetical protein CYLTODRAFT_425907 [Cylindrobasidium torrendii FP15055 ss-10]